MRIAMRLVALAALGACAAPAEWVTSPGPAGHMPIATLARGGRIVYGWVWTPNGTPVAGARVTLRPYTFGCGQPRDSATVAVTDSTGYYWAAVSSEVSRRPTTVTRRPCGALLSTRAEERGG